MTDTLPKGPWFSRLLIRLLTVTLGVLVYWLLGFLTGDIRAIKGPDFQEIEARVVPASLRAEAKDLQEQLDRLAREIEGHQETRALLADSSRNLQQTINQLLELRKAGLERNAELSEQDRAHFAATLNLFLEQQRKYQELSQVAADLVARQQDLKAKLEANGRAQEIAREPARASYQSRMESHRLRLAVWQLTLLLPVLALATWLMFRGARSPFQPVFLAIGLATLLKVGLVMHEYFPRKYFKYILIAALILTVGRFLVHQIRRLTRPQRDWLLKQYREAYERFLCPVCEYPIRTGPRRYLFWTRRTVNKLVVPVGAEQAAEAYTCPCCGTGLFAKCTSCGAIRHRLLPHCASCGNREDSGNAQDGSGK